MADKRTKALLRDELRMAYEQIDMLKLRVIELESTINIEKVTASLEELFTRVKATLSPSDPEKP